MKYIFKIGKEFLLGQPTVHLHCIDIGLFRQSGCPRGNSFLNLASNLTFNILSWYCIFKNKVFDLF